MSPLSKAVCVSHSCQTFHGPEVGHGPKNRVNYELKPCMSQNNPYRPMSSGDFTITEVFTHATSRHRDNSKNNVCNRRSFYTPTGYLYWDAQYINHMAIGCLYSIRKGSIKEAGNGKRSRTYDGCHLTLLFMKFFWNGFGTGRCGTRVACIVDWPQTHCIPENDLKLLMLLPPTNPVPESQMRTTMPSSTTQNEAMDINTQVPEMSVTAVRMRGGICDFCEVTERSVTAVRMR
ncbi:hypothetical protein STEG23_032752, partial [Scotinomys teguina]